MGRRLNRGASRRAEHREQQGANGRRGRRRHWVAVWQRRRSGRRLSGAIMVWGASAWQSNSCQGVDTIRASRGERVVSGGIGTGRSTAAAFVSSVRLSRVVLVGNSGLSLWRCGLGIGGSEMQSASISGQIPGCAAVRMSGTASYGCLKWLDGVFGKSISQFLKRQNLKAARGTSGGSRTPPHHSAAQKNRDWCWQCASTVLGLCRAAEGPSCTPTLWAVRAVANPAQRALGDPFKRGFFGRRFALPFFFFFSSLPKTTTQILASLPPNCPRAC